MIKIENDTVNANESTKEVEKRTIFLDKEKAEIMALASDAQRDMEKAEPILLKAEEGLANLKKEKLAEVKAYAKPPDVVGAVCSVVMILLGKDTSWASVKKELTDPNFLGKLQNYEKENISQNTIKKIEKYTHRADMDRDIVARVSDAAGCMWDWVLAMEEFSKAFKDIEPKRKKVAQLKDRLQKSEDELQQLQENCLKLKQTVITLNEQLSKFKGDMI